MVAVYGVSNGFLLPLLSLLLEARGVSAGLIGLTAAAAALGTLLSAPCVPALMARFGLVRCIALGLGADVLLIVLLPLLPSLGAWLCIRLAMGVSLGLLYAASETWINELAEEHSRGRLMGIYNGVLAASFGAGPLIILLTGTDGWTPFVAAAGIILCAAATLPLAVRHAPVMRREAGLSMLRIVGAAPVLVLGVLLVATIYGALWALMPVYGLRVGLGTEQSAVLLTVVAAGGVMLQYPLGWLGDVVDRHAVLLGCAALSGLAALALPLVVQQAVLLYPVLFLWGGTFTAIYTMAMTIGGQRFRGTALAVLMAAFGAMWGLGSLLGPLLGGWAMELWPPHGLVAVPGVAAAGFVLFALWRWRRAGPR